jgi:hypothetical protein
VRLVEENGAQQVRIQPRPAPVAAPQQQPPPAPPEILSAVLDRVIETLSASITRDQAAALAPDAAALPAPVVRALLEVLVGGDRIGAQLARVAMLMEAAIAAGSLPAALGDKLRTIIRRLQAETADEFLRVVASVRESLRGRGPEAAHAARRDAAGGASLLDDLVSLRDEVLARIDRTGTPGDAVLKSLDSLIERFEAARLPNIRGFEAPYQFIAIPLSNRTGFERAQVHFFGDESRRGAGEPAHHAVVFDLDLSRLGSLWIVVQASGAGCSCVIRATLDAARRALADAAPSLEDALRSVGYAGASVRAEPWDGDRIAALTGMMGRLSSFEALA